MPLKEAPERRLPVRRIISVVTLAVVLGVLVLMLHKPKPVAPPRSPQVLAAGAESLQAKVNQLAAPADSGQSSEPVRLTSDEIAAAIAQAAGTLPASGAITDSTSDADNPVAAMEGVPTLTEPIVTFEGDEVKGQFVSDLGGKKGLRDRRRPSRLKRWLRHLRAYGVQGRRSECPGVAGQ